MVGWEQRDEFQGRRGDDGRASISLLCYYHVLSKGKFADVFEGWRVWGASFACRHVTARWLRCYLGEERRVDCLQRKCSEMTPVGRTMWEMISLHYGNPSSCGTITGFIIIAADDVRHRNVCAVRSERLESFILGGTRPPLVILYKSYAEGPLAKQMEK